MKFLRSLLHKRHWLLFLLLLAAIGIAWTQRNWIARVPNQLARRALRQHELPAADRWLGIARWISSGNPETEFLQARVYRRQGRMDDARSHLERASKLGWPLDLIQREQLFALAQAGQMSEAEPFLPGLLADARDEGDEISGAYIIGYLKMRRFDLARTLAEAWIQDFPLDAQPVFWKAMIDREMDQSEAAERGLRWAIELKPDHHDALLMLAEVLFNDRKMAQEALEFYRRAQSGGTTQKAAATIGIAKSLRTLGRHDEAIAELNNFLAVTPGNIDAIVTLADILIERGQYARAIEQLRPIVIENTLNKDVRYVYGVALRGVGKNDEAMPHLEYATKAAKDIVKINHQIQLVPDDPKNAELRFEIGRGLLSYGSTREGLVWLESALQCDPNHEETHGALADYYEQRAGEGDSAYSKLAAHHRQFAADKK